MLKIRRPLGRLIFNMGITIPGKTVFLIETAPCRRRVLSKCKYTKVIWSYTPFNDPNNSWFAHHGTCNTRMCVKIEPCPNQYFWYKTTRMCTRFDFRAHRHLVPWGNGNFSRVCSVNPADNLRCWQPSGMVMDSYGKRDDINILCCNVVLLCGRI